MVWKTGAMYQDTDDASGYDAVAERRIGERFSGDRAIQFGRGHRRVRIAVRSRYRVFEALLICVCVCVCGCVW